jgi:hypothetical protein
MSVTLSPIHIYFDLVIHQTVLCLKFPINPLVIYIFKHWLMVLHNGFHYIIEDSFNDFHYLETTTS